VSRGSTYCAPVSRVTCARPPASRVSASQRHASQREASRRHAAQHKVSRYQPSQRHLAQRHAFQRHVTYRFGIIFLLIARSPVCDRANVMFPQRVRSHVPTHHAIPVTPVPPSAPSTTPRTWSPFSDRWGFRRLYIFSPMSHPYNTTRLGSTLRATYSDSSCRINPKTCAVPDLSLYFVYFYYDVGYLTMASIPILLWKW